MEFVGRKVKVSVNDNSTYDGFLHSIDSGLGKLTLEKVVCTDEDGEKTKLYGLQNVFNHEITSIFVGEDVIKSRSTEPVIDGTKNRDRCVLKNKLVNPHLNKIRDLENAKLTLKNMHAEDGMNSSGNDDGLSSEGDEDIANEDYTVIAKLNNIFYEAIEHIRKYVVIGVAMEGVSLGRNGKLCWVQIATPGHVIMFDILRLGKAAFSEGLKDVLEAESILKVFHDCRMVSDIMYHQYGVDLNNVFDTQVANVFVYRLQHHNDWPRYVHGLASCLMEHLNLDESQVNWAVVREGFREVDEEVWLQRPIKRNHLEALWKNVKHLLDLRQVLMEKMMEEYVAGVNIYISHARDASNGDVQKCQKMSYLLPSTFQDIHMFMRPSKSPYFRRNNLATDRNGFRENFSPINNPLWGYKVPAQSAKSTDDNKSGKAAEKSGNINETRRTTQPLSQYVSQIPNSLSKCDADDQTPQPASLHSNGENLKQMPLATRPQSNGGILKQVQTSPALYSSAEQQTKLSNHIAKFNETPRRADITKSEEFPQSCPSHVTEAVEIINSGQQINSSSSLFQGYSSGGSEASVWHNPLETNSVKQPKQLSGSSLMRALINKQAPHGAETHTDLDKMTFMPAGKVVERNTGVRKKKAAVSAYQLDKPVSTPLMKHLTEQESYLEKKINTNGGNRSENKRSIAHGNTSISAEFRKKVNDHDIHVKPRVAYSLQQDVSNTEGQKWDTDNESKEGDSPTWQTASSSHNVGAQLPRETMLPSNQLTNQMSSSEDEASSMRMVQSSRKSNSPNSGRLQALMQVLNKHQLSAQF